MANKETLLSAIAFERMDITIKLLTREFYDADEDEDLQFKMCILQYIFEYVLEHEDSSVDKILFDLDRKFTERLDKGRIFSIATDVVAYLNEQCYGGVLIEDHNC